MARLLFAVFATAVVLSGCGLEDLADDLFHEGDDDDNVVNTFDKRPKNYPEVRRED